MIVPITARFRRLPRPVRPFPNEVLYSYLHRLAGSNFLNPKVFYREIQQSSSNSETLARLTGVPELHLRFALPELDMSALTLRLVHRRRFWEQGPPCRFCLASRGIPPTDQTVRIWIPVDHPICLRHRIWVRDDFNRPGFQLSVAEFPDIVKAQVRHRRLTSRFGPGPVEEMVSLAEQTLQAETLNPRSKPPDVELPYDRRIRTFRKLDQNAERYRSFQDAAYYPEVVTLTTMMISPYWRSVVSAGTLGQKTRFFQELHRIGVIRGPLPKDMAVFEHWIAAPIIAQFHPPPEGLWQRPRQR